MEVEQATINNLRKVVELVSPQETVTMHVSTLGALVIAYDSLYALDDAEVERMAAVVRDELKGNPATVREFALEESRHAMWEARHYMTRVREARHMEAAWLRIAAEKEG